MDKEVVSRLIYSLIQFLKNQLQYSGTNGILSQEATESVEVAVQCLETAYGISLDSTHLSVQRSLYDIFSEGIKDEVNMTTNSANHFGYGSGGYIDREEAERLKNAGNSLMREEKYDEALDCYSRAISIDRDNSVYYCNRAAAHSKMNNHNKAIEDCKRALNIDPQYSKAFGRMGLAYSALDNAFKAKECYQKALELEPDNESYHSNLQIAEEKLRSQSQQSSSGGNFNPFASFGGGSGFNIVGNLAGFGSGGTPDIQGLFNNPGLMNVVTQLMQDPNIQNMMTNFLGGMGSGSVPGGSSSSPSDRGGSSTGGTSPSGDSMEALLTAGRQLAEQMQAQHPDLVDQIRANMNRSGGSADESGSQGPQNPPPT